MLRKVISLAVFSLVLFNSQLMLSANDDLNQNDQEEQLANEDMVEETSNEDNDLEQTDENQESDTKTEEYDEEQQTEKVDEESNNETVDEKEVNKEVIEENNEESSKKVSVEKQGDLETTEKINEEEEPQVFSKGDRSPQIIEFKEQLNAIGFGYITVTELFGSFTEKQVKKFQEYYGLEVNGQLDLPTQQLINDIHSNSLQQGHSDQQLIELKTKMNRLGYGNILVTTYFGNFTEKKLKEFQSDYGLISNGIFDSKTLEELNTVYNTGFSVGARHKGIPALKNKLDHAGFGGMLITDYFGDYTKTRVEDFQAYYGLDVTGSITEETFEKVEELYNHPLQYDKRHSALPGIKEQLNRIGFGNILVTNYFGAFSEKKVKEFQRAYSLVDHGIVDDKTREQLDAITNSPFQKGKRHKDTSEFKVMLNRLGFGYITVTDYFGDFSEKKVKDFQRTYDLVEHGIIDSITQEKLESIYHSPFQKGKRHEDLPELKRNLNKLGFGNIKVTNYFGDFSEKKVKQFQRYFGLPDHGIIDDKTLEKLNEIYNSPMQKGKRHKDIIELKENLNSLGYGNILVTNYYGDFTEKKVKEFQKDYGLPVSGIADFKTVEEIESRIIKVFIDPGHGGHDPGGTGYGLEEKNVALDIALSAVKYLNQIKGVRVNISRNDDTFVVLEDRSKMANEWGADYFISVHNNAFMGVGKGFESYVHTTASKTEKQIQSVLHEHLISKIGGVDRGQHEANFNVLRNTNMPAILLEYLFIDNYEENQKLRQASYRDWLGKITADAFKKAIPLID
ncbi:peptidoglycan-binding protein [Piscibacillus sp. B03]|uniref:peptidoglycan-binding protein n=1 Tax=Piscibacillus sp. B03 TaxID=3457430 RepID=UPI003FCD4F28